MSDQPIPEKTARENAQGDQARREQAQSDQAQRETAQDEKTSASPVKFRAVRGVRDILPPESALWNRVEQTAREVFAAYGYGEIRLPILEQTDLFARAVGTRNRYCLEGNVYIRVRLRIEVMRDALLEKEASDRPLREILDEADVFVHTFLSEDRYEEARSSPGNAVRCVELKDLLHNLKAALADKDPGAQGFFVASYGGTG